uniref:Uncharacterized protein n=1 Tax=Arundo donax TaxID=35708 RepID=A0A0A9FD01_ARUDO
MFCIGPEIYSLELVATSSTICVEVMLELDLDFLFRWLTVSFVLRFVCGIAVVGAI